MSVKNGLADGLTYAIAMKNNRRMISRWVRLSTKLTEDEARELVAAYRDDPKFSKGKGWTVRLGVMAI